MAEEIAMPEVMKLLESEPAPAALPAALPAANIPELREQLAILVSTGKCKEADRQESHTRRREAARREKCNELLQKVRNLRWRQDN